MIFVFIYYANLRLINKRLITIVFKHKMIRNNLDNGQTQIQYNVFQCLYDHFQIWFFLIHINRKLISPIFYMFSLTILMLNTYLIVFLWFRNISILFSYILFLFWLSFIVSFIFVILNLIQLNEELLSTAKPFYNILLLLNQKYLIIQKRWKLATCYEMLKLSIKPFYFTAGPLGDLNKHRVYEVNLISINFYSKIFFYLFPDDFVLLCNFVVFWRKIYHK